MSTFKVGDKVTRENFDALPGTIVHIEGSVAWVKPEARPEGCGMLVSVSELRAAPPAPVWPESVMLRLYDNGEVDIGTAGGTRVRTISLATPSLEDMGKAGVVVGRRDDGGFTWIHLGHRNSGAWSTSGFNDYDSALADARRYCKESQICAKALEAKGA